VLYCEYWRGKLESNEDVEFPRILSYKIAEITGDFSFATMQEAFVGALLQLASGDEADVVDGFQEVLISVGGADEGTIG
jgi:transitional endoplasmic reticulum ATPase